MNHLMWIGPTQSRFFRAGHDWCQAHFDALTIRNDLFEAVSRACFPPTHVAVVRDDSCAIDGALLQTLVDRFPDSMRMEFRGPLCEGFFRVADPRYNAGIHRWTQLTNMMGQRIGITRVPCPHAFHLVVADQFATASAWMECLGPNVRATFCQTLDQACSGSRRGVTDVWWHESTILRDRIGSTEPPLQSFDPSVRHHFLTTETLV